MTAIALEMLFGDRGKFIAIVVGITFAALIMTQQPSIFLGLLTRTYAFIDDVPLPDVWVMDPGVEYVDEHKPMRDTALARVRGVDGVAWAVPMYKALINARLPDGQSKAINLAGLDDPSLIGGPPEMIEGNLGDLRLADGIIIDVAAANDRLRYRDPAGNLQPLKVGDNIEINDRRAVVVGISRSSPDFILVPKVFTTYSRALEFAPRQSRQLSYVLVKARDGVAAAELAGRIEAATGLKTATRDGFRWLTLSYWMTNTGIPINFGISVTLGFLVGAAIAGQSFYNFVREIAGSVRGAEGDGAAQSGAGADGAGAGAGRRRDRLWPRRRAHRAVRYADERHRAGLSDAPGTAAVLGGRRPADRDARRAARHPPGGPARSGRGVSQLMPARAAAAPADRPEPAIAIACEGLTRSFVSAAGTVWALRGVDLEVPAGKVAMLVGPSGCGKTTLISVIAGILKRDGGVCRVFGEDLEQLSRRDLLDFRARSIGFIFQQFHLLPTLSVVDNVAVPLLINGCERRLARERAARLLAEVGLGERTGDRPLVLSGGEQQRVAIARALVHGPRLIVCDEPTSALDHDTGVTIMEMLRRIVHDKGATLLIVTHDNRIFPFADLMARMDDGAITEVLANGAGPGH